jgi:hypothetical protein
MLALWVALANTVAAVGAPESAQPSPDGGPGPQVRIVVEPGKPMQYEVVTPDPDQKVVEPCGLEGVKARRQSLSSACLRCHDGSEAPEAPDARTGHAFDVVYEPILKPNLRRSPEDFNAAVVLVEGKVTCLTCHDPRSKMLYHLVGPTDGPVEKRFCVACHLRD